MNSLDVVTRAISRSIRRRANIAIGVGGAAIEFPEYAGGVGADEARRSLADVTDDTPAMRKLVSHRGKCHEAVR